MKNLIKTLTLSIASTAFLFGTVACEERSPAEKAGDAVEEAGEEVGDAIEDATD